VLDPKPNWLPSTVSDAVATPPDPDSATAPRTVSPRVNETFPAGEVVPEAALTVAVNMVEPAGVILEFVAVTPVVVATAAGGSRVREKVSELLPNIALMWAVVLVVTAEVVTVKVLLDWPDDMFTEDGTVAAEASLVRSTVVVLDASLLKLSVQVDDVGGVTLEGLQLKEESTGCTG
jgi:hypothetical protein